MDRRLPAKQFQVGSIPTGVFFWKYQNCKQWFARPGMTKCERYSDNRATDRIKQGLTGVGSGGNVIRPCC